MILEQDAALLLQRPPKSGSENIPSMPGRSTLTRTFVSCYVNRRNDRIWPRRLDAQVKLATGPAGSTLSTAGDLLLKLRKLFVIPDGPRPCRGCAGGRLRWSVTLGATSGADVQCFGRRLGRSYYAANALAYRISLGVHRGSAGRADDHPTAQPQVPASATTPGFRLLRRSPGSSRRLHHRRGRTSRVIVVVPSPLPGGVGEVKSAQ